MLRLVLLLAALSLYGQETYDLVIAGGTVYDGSGAAGRRADVGIRGGRIAAVGDLARAARKRTIDAKGLAVVPGFIDMHNHSDDSVIDEPKCESMIRQGVTTMVLGEGDSQGPIKPGLRPWTTLGGYFDYIQKKGVATNLCSYVGEGRIWTYVKGEDFKPATPAEMDAMKKEVARAMQEGAMGISTMLMMPPGSLATTAELTELAKVAKQYGGVFSSHIHDEGAGVFDSVAQVIAIAKGANIRADIIHLKIADKEYWGQMPKLIGIIQKARDQGLDIRANVYPYTAGSNNLASIIPPWAHEGGTQEMLKRLRDPQQRTRIHHDVLSGLPGWYDHYLAVGGDWSAMLLVTMNNPKNRPFIGKRMSELIAARGGDPVNVLFDVLLEENGSVPTIYFHHSEPDMQYAMKQPFTSIGSDGTAISPYGPRGKTHPHPRYYGTFPRVLGRYTRELKVLTLPEAIHKMTGMNADKISIPDRGLLKTGYWADVTVFDPQTVADKATFVQPHQYPVGIPYVIVNGQVVIDRGEHTGALPGRVLRGPGYRK